MKLLLLGLISFFSASQVFGWEKSGHALICGAASYGLSNQVPFFKSVSFDLGYYCNVPDFIWKREKTYKTERDEHFVDLEIVKKAMGDKPEWNRDRSQFFKKFPDAREAGYAFWRISEMCDELGVIGKKIDVALKSKGAEKVLHNLYAEWLATAGALGHYVGDLAQPLHTTENYDGQKTNQRGVHAYYEHDQVNELYPEITPSVYNRVAMDLKDQKSKDNMDCFDLARELAETSFSEVKELLDSDKKLGRSDVMKAAKANQTAIVRQMSRGSVYLSLMWQKYLPSSFNPEKFHSFLESPKYPVPPGKNISQKEGKGVE